MASLEQIFQFTTSVLGETVRRIGDKNSPTTFTTAGQVFDTGGVVIPDAFGNSVLWQAGQGSLTTIEYLLFLSDKDVVVEIANGTPNPDERMLFQVKANALLALPGSFMGGYASNTTRLDGSALVLNTDYGGISEVRVQRDVADLAGDATVRLVLLK